LFKFAPIKQWRKTVPKLGLTTQTKVWTDKVEEEGKKPKASPDGSLNQIYRTKKSIYFSRKNCRRGRLWPRQDNLEDLKRWRNSVGQN
jgi:hypothetical protein